MAAFVALPVAFAFDDEFVGRRLHSVTINNPSLKHQIEFDRVDDVFSKREESIIQDPFMKCTFKQQRSLK